MSNGSGERKHGGMGLPGEPLKVITRAELGIPNTVNAPTLVGLDRAQVVVRALSAQMDVDSLRPLVTTMSPGVVRRIKEAEGIKYMGQ